MNFPFIFNNVKQFWDVNNILKGFVDDLRDFLPVKNKTCTSISPLQ